MKRFWKTLFFACQAGVITAQVAVTPYINEAQASGSCGSGNCINFNTTDPYININATQNGIGNSVNASSGGNGETFVLTQTFTGSGSNNVFNINQHTPGGDVVNQINSNVTLNATGNSNTINVDMYDVSGASDSNNHINELISGNSNTITEVLNAVNGTTVTGSIYGNSNTISDSITGGNGNQLTESIGIAATPVNNNGMLNAIVGAGNIISLSQQGNGNSMGITTNGSTNNVNAKQVGDNNELTGVTINGSGNSAQLTQTNNEPGTPGNTSIGLTLTGTGQHWVMNQTK